MSVSVTQPLRRRAIGDGFLTATGSGVLILGVLATSQVAGPAAVYGWAWLLTTMQVTGMWALGKSRPWGWLLGTAAQPVWIAYAVVTSQLGFVPGCLISTVVQLGGYRRAVADHTSSR